jgi:hypothetical protein
MKKDEAKRVQSLHAGAVRALKQAVTKAIAEHKSAGVPAAIWQDGKVVLIRGSKKSHRSTNNGG